MDVDTLLAENRFDASSLQVFPFDGWKALGLRATHLPRLGSAALAAFAPHRWRSIGLVPIDLPTLGIGQQDAAERWDISVHDMLCALAAKGDYQLVCPVATHEISLDDLGNGVSDTAPDGHSHQVLDGAVPDLCRLVRYID